MVVAGLQELGHPSPPPVAATKFFVRSPGKKTLSFFYKNFFGDALAFRVSAALRENKATGATPGASIGPDHEKRSSSFRENASYSPAEA